MGSRSLAPGLWPLAALRAAYSDATGGDELAIWGADGFVAPTTAKTSPSRLTRSPCGSGTPSQPKEASADERVYHGGEGIWSST